MADFRRLRLGGAFHLNGDAAIVKGAWKCTNPGKRDRTECIEGANIITVTFTSHGTSADLPPRIQCTTKFFLVRQERIVFVDQ